MNYIKNQNGEAEDTEEEKKERKKFGRMILERAKEINGVDCLREEEAGKEDDSYRFFRHFVEMCLVHMVTKSCWAQFKKTRKVSEIFTDADEALAILLVENNAEEWLLESEDPERYKNQSKDRKKRRKFTHKSSNDTLGDGGTGNNEGTSTSRRRNEGKVKGWVQAGVDRYNFLLDITEEKRKENQQQNNTEGGGEHMPSNASLAWERALRRYYVSRESRREEEDDDATVPQCVDTPQNSTASDSPVFRKARDLFDRDDIDDGCHLSDFNMDLIQNLIEL